MIADALDLYLRQKHRCTSTEAGRLVGVSAGNWYRYCSGKTTPTEPTINKWLQALGGEVNVTLDGGSTVITDKQKRPDHIE